MINAIHSALSNRLGFRMLDTILQCSLLKVALSFRNAPNPRGTKYWMVVSGETLSRRVSAAMRSELAFVCLSSIYADRAYPNVYTSHFSVSY